MEKIEKICNECGRVVAGDEEYMYCPYCGEPYIDEDLMADWAGNWVVDNT